MNRRSFIVGAAALSLTPLAGCTRNNQPTLSVRLLKNSIPAIVLNRFRKHLGRSFGLRTAVLDFKSDPQLNNLFEQLQSWKRQPLTQPEPKSILPFDIPFVTSRATPIPDLVTLGDYWLAKAIEQKLIQPFEPTQLSSWQQLPKRWQELVRRSDRGLLDPQGQVWAAPYRWGTTVIAYRTDHFKKEGWNPPTDWRDLWRQEFKGRISLPDQPREVIGLTLKKLGKSYNTQSIDTVSDLKNQLLLLQQQVKFYSSTTYLQPLILGDSSLAVGWSSDLLPLIRDNPKIAAVIPQSGTALWADLWVRPAQSTPSDTDLLQQWINFTWQPDIASQLSLQTKAASPIFSDTPRAELPKDLEINPLLLPDLQILSKSEFLQPLPDATLDRYRSLWAEIRTSKS